MANIKVARLTRPSPKDTLKKGTTPTPSAQEQSPAKQDKLEEVSGKSDSSSGEQKPSDWSGWLWSEESRIYYRARKDSKGIWQYEYTGESNSTANTTSVPIRVEELSYYEPPKTEYPVQQKSLLYKREKTYSGVTARGESIYLVAAVCEELKTPVPVEEPKSEAKPKSQASKPASPQKAPEDKKKCKSTKTKVCAERVDEWRRQINVVPQEAEDAKETSDVKVTKTSKHKREKHSRKREEKQKESRW